MEVLLIRVKIQLQKSCRGEIKAWIKISDFDVIGAIYWCLSTDKNRIQPEFWPANPSDSLSNCWFNVGRADIQDYTQNRRYF